MAAQPSLTGRERDARAAGLNGIESVTADAGGRRLAVTLFGPAPDGLEPGNFRIDGGVVARDLRVVAVTVAGEADPGRIVLDLDRPGDISRYTLAVVTAGPGGRPGHQPLGGFDPLFARAPFSFALDCPAPADCRPQPCPPAAFPQPGLDYLAKDYASLRRELLERLSLIMPSWAEQHAADLMVTLVELLAYAGDELSYQQDAVAAEAYLDTARLRTSVRRHARLVDYTMHDGCAARAFACLDSGAEVTLPAGTFRFLAGDQVFEPVPGEAVTVRPQHSRISLWTWGEPDYCLPEGATSAALADGAVDGTGERTLALAPGDVLVFEEIIGAATGLEADADLTHRQAVRLVDVRHATDPLYGQDLVEVTWARPDALRFCLRVRAVGGPQCVSQEVAVARGNAVLAEHGASHPWCGAQPDTLSWPAQPPGVPGCPCPPDFGCADTGPATLPPYPPLPLRFAPAVPQAGTTPVTWSAPFPRPRGVARGQARRLGSVADRAHARLLALLAAAQDGTAPDDEATAWLRTVFGPAVLGQVRLAQDPAGALRLLAARFGELLERKLARLDELARRARAGYVLQAGDEGWEIGQSWGAAEGTALDPGAPAFRGPAAVALAPDPRQALPAVRAGLEGDDPPWTPARGLLDAGPQDRAFVPELDDDGLLHLRFGDGRTGAVPPPGSTLRLWYRLGTGTAGNVGAEAIDTMELCGVAGVTVTVRNPLPATGGTDPEPVAQVRRRAPEEAFRRLLRAITADDYAALAGQVTGVQRAGAQLRWTGSWYEAQVAVDALGTEEPPARLLAEVRERLHRYRRIGHGLVVGPARLVPLHLAVCVLAEPGAVTEHVRTAVAGVLGHGLLPDGTLGLFHPDALTFGTPVRISRIVAAVAAVPGVSSADVTALERLFEPSQDALRDGVLLLRPDEIAQLDADPARPEHGILELLMRGGR